MPVVVVTGASQGIGRATAIAFAREPDARLVLMSRNEDAMEEVAGACADHGAESVIMPCDVTDDAAVADCAQAVLDDWGAPDVLVNNAGLFVPASFTETTPKVFREQIEVNLTSAFVLTSLFLPSMIERGSGHIFYLASVASIRGYPGGVAYSAAKHGVLGLARTLRDETKDTGIRVTSIIPGATYTASWAASDLPEERFMPSEDVADSIVAAYKLSGRSVVEEILLRPQRGDV